MALERKVSVVVEMQKGADTLSPALDQTKSKADAATSSLEKAKTAGSQVASVPTGSAAANAAVPGGSQLGNVPPPISRVEATSPGGARVEAEVRKPTDIEKGIEKQEAALKRSIATFGMSKAEIAAWDLANRGATSSQLANVQALAAQQRALKETAAAEREAAREAKATGLFSQQNNQLQERISKVQRVAGLAGMAMAATGIGGDVGNIAGAALGGAAAGAMFGPLGAAIGGAVGGLGAFTQSLGSTAQKLEEAGKRASATFGAESTLRALRRGDRPTDAALIAAAPEAMARIAALPEAERPEGLRREAAAARTERERLEAMPAASRGGFDRFIDNIVSSMGLREFSTPERITRAATAEAGLAGAVRAVDAGIAPARVAGGGSGGAGFMEESITSALLAEPDDSVGILTAIRETLIRIETGGIPLRLEPAAT